MRIRLSARPLARSVGLFALGQMRSELVGGRARLVRGATVASRSEQASSRQVTIMSRVSRLRQSATQSGPRRSSAQRRQLRRAREHLATRLRPAVVRIAWRYRQRVRNCHPVFGWGVAEPARWETGSIFGARPSKLVTPSHFNTVLTGSGRASLNTRLRSLAE